MATNTIAVQPAQEVTLLIEKLPKYWNVEWFSEGSNRFSFNADKPDELSDILAVCQEIALARTKRMVKKKSVKSKMKGIEERKIESSQLKFKRHPPLVNSIAYTQFLNYDGVDYPVGEISITPGPDDVWVEAVVVLAHSTLHVPPKNWFQDAMDEVEMMLESPENGPSLVFLKYRPEPLLGGCVIEDSKGEVHIKGF